MFTLKELYQWATFRGEPGGKWFPSRPLLSPFICRLRDAWEVLRGRADAFTWPEGQ